MAKKENRTRKARSKISRIQQTTRATPKTAIRKMRAAGNAKLQVKTQKATKTKTPAQPLPKTVAGVNRSEGIRLFKLAGRPSKDDFIAVYGPAGPKMTWEERSAAGVPAEKFQAALGSATRK